MSNLVTLPAPKGNIYSDRLQTAGALWTGKEKRLIDRAEFFEAMILVLDDVKMQNIQSRDYAMVEIVTEEIAHYQSRLDDVQEQLARLRSEYHRGLREWAP